MLRLCCIGISDELTIQTYLASGNLPITRVIEGLACPELLHLLLGGRVRRKEEPSSDVLSLPAASTHNSKNSASNLAMA